MLTSIHLVAGAAIGKATGSFWLAIPISVISHYLLDIIPHYNQKPVENYLEKGFLGSNKKDLLVKSIEPLVGIFLVAYSAIYLNPNIAWVMIVSAFFGWLPDFLVFLRWKYRVNIIPFSLFKKFEEKCHHHALSLQGIAIQLIIFILFSIYIIL